ncbi:MAG: hypothetical protein ABW019_11550 [Chitinophagaceae bacterium]
MKRWTLLCGCLFISLLCFSQSFPQSWCGSWKGELFWYQGAGKEPKTVHMELRIGATDSAHRFSWQLIYGSAAADIRPYELIAKDTAKGHWVIDEKNGIFLDQYWMAGRLSGVFTVQQSTIINHYWMQDGELHAEFCTIGARPIATTGKGDEESPLVDSYQVKGYQKAVLRRE